MQALEDEILAYLLIDFSLIEKADVNERLFLRKRNRDIFKAGYELYENNGNRQLDISTLAEKLEKKKISTYDLVEITTGVQKMQPANFGFKVQKLKEKRLVEKIIKGVHEMAKEGKFDVDKTRRYLKEIEKLEIKEIKAKPLSKRTALPVKWLWRNRFPLGTVSLIAGEKESGKSTLCEWIAAHVTTGEDWPDVENNEEGSVIIAQTENDWDRQVVPILDAFKANRDKIFEFDPLENDTTKICDNLRILIRKIGDVRLILFDPITEYVGNLEGNAEIPVRHALKPFFDIAHEFNLAILFVKHLRKAPAGNILEKIGGSGSWVNVPRAVWIVAKDEKDEREERRKFIKGALNLTRETTDLAFSIFNRNGYPFIAWEEEPLDRDEGKSEFMDPEEKEKLTAKAYAKEFILATLEAVEDLNSDDLKETCLSDGISKASYDRAKSELYKQKKVDRFQRGGTWYWKKI